MAQWLFVHCLKIKLIQKCHIFWREENKRKQRKPLKQGQIQQQTQPALTL